MYIKSLTLYIINTLVLSNHVIFALIAPYPHELYYDESYAIVNLLPGSQGPCKKV